MLSPATPPSAPPVKVRCREPTTPVALADGRASRRAQLLEVEFRGDIQGVAFEQEIPDSACDEFITKYICGVQEFHYEYVNDDEARAHCDASSRPRIETAMATEVIDARVSMPALGKPCEPRADAVVATPNAADSGLSAALHTTFEDSGDEGDDAGASADQKSAAARWTPACYVARSLRR